MMIVALTAQGASSFRVKAAYRRSTETVRSSKPNHSRKIQATTTIAAVTCCSPELRQLFSVSIPMRVVRGETGVAAVSERYCGDNVFRVETYSCWLPPASVASVEEISCNSLLFKTRTQIA
jgi:hypothetical protein